MHPPHGEGNRDLSIQTTSPVGTRLSTVAETPDTPHSPAQPSLPQSLARLFTSSTPQQTDSAKRPRLDAPPYPAALFCALARPRPRSGRPARAAGAASHESVREPSRDTIPNGHL
ncbi:Serine/threonine-protein kinase ATR [Frankliniella fusca]|uniref:Serine/threonine-protein kinase ATR n=1 Tax=Frankliniella fusca TaxID=407009 RepID=A0AAE1LDE6_9NEOP|nr:Serine/threonine-protein kinase ATR [Frankliniella fusca]